MKKIMKDRHIIAGIVMIISSAIFLVFMVWWVFPYKTLEVKTPYPVLNKEVKQGEVLFYIIDYCKATEAQAVVRRQFVDGIIYATPEVTANLKKGCGIVKNTVTIPHNLPAGEYYLDITINYEVNPIRVISKNAVTENFTVIK